MLPIKYSDFEKACTNKKLKLCSNCANLEVDITGYEFAECSAMHLTSNGYQKKENIDDFTGFGNVGNDNRSAFIHLLIRNGNFPNARGNCPYYKKQWWKFWVKD